MGAKGSSGAFLGDVSAILFTRSRVRFAEFGSASVLRVSLLPFDGFSPAVVALGPSGISHVNHRVLLLLHH